MHRLQSGLIDTLLSGPCAVLLEPRVMRLWGKCGTSGSSATGHCSISLCVPPQAHHRVLLGLSHMGLPLGQKLHGHMSYQSPRAHLSLCGNCNEKKEGSRQLRSCSLVLPEGLHHARFSCVHIRPGKNRQEQPEKGNT